MKNFNSGDHLLTVLEALSNSHRLRIISILAEGRQYVSQLARELSMSRPLLYLHLQKLEGAELVSGELEILDNGKTAKFYTLNSFQFELNEQLIHGLAESLTVKKKTEHKGE